MAERTRVYKSTDWQVWFYEPVANKFRLDFSVLNGPDVLSATDGSMAATSYGIAEIFIRNNGPLDNGVVGIPTGSTASIVLKTDSVTKNSMKEFYQGKKVVITLKNEETTRTHAIYGQNTPMFTGFITTASLSYQPNNYEHEIVIEAQDALQYVLNTLQTITKANGSFTDTIDGIYALKGFKLMPDDALNVNYVPQPESMSLPSNPQNAMWETNGSTETQSIGSWLENLSYIYTAKFAICSITNLYAVSASQFDFFRHFYFRPQQDKELSPSIKFPQEQIFNVTLENDMANLANVFNFTTPSGLQYSSGIYSAGSINNLVQLDKTIDAQLGLFPQIVANARSVVNEYAPIEIDILQATDNQEIVFDDSLFALDAGFTGFYFPKAFKTIGEKTTFDLSQLGFSNFETKIVYGQEITVTKDNWTTKYMLGKML